MLDKKRIAEWRNSLEVLRRGGPFLTDQSIANVLGLLERFVEFSDTRGSVLDIGCGQGDYLRKCRASGRVGIDPLPSSLRDERFVKGVGEYLPFRDSTFDGVVSMALLDHCLSPERILEESSRVLKPSGGFYVWMQVTRSDFGFKARRMLHYLKTLDVRSLYVSIKSNADVFLRGKGSRYDYGHIHAFTEKELIDMVSGHFEITRKELHSQDIFIAARK